MITMKDIVREGHPSLREKAKEVTVPPLKEDIQLLNKMITFLKNSQDEEIAEKHQLRSGDGLAAPQLGVNKRLIAIHFDDQDEQLHGYQLINTRIVSHSVQHAYLASGEGSLSVDRNVDGYVVRQESKEIKGIGIDCKPIKLRFRGYPAIVIQHKIYQLNGVMFLDHINKQDPYFVPENAWAIE